jgi:hypothetical protein
MAFAATRADAVVGPSESGDAYGDRVVPILTKGPEGSGLCTGIVLTPDILLTAAHCVRPPSDMAILLHDAGGGYTLVPVARAERHPGYRADAIVARKVSIDAGLVELATPLGAAFRPATLGDSAPGVGDAVTIVGFGERRAGDTKSSGVLRQADLAVRAPLSHILLWAKGVEAGSGACSGDSGGPMFASEGTVAAIVAWVAAGDRAGCGALTQGPLVAPIKPWIEETLARWRRP